MKLTRVAIFSDLLAASGVHQADIPLDELFRATLAEKLDGKTQLELLIDRSGTAFTSLQNRRALVCDFANNTTNEFRISKFGEARAQDAGKRAPVTARGVLFDLNNGVVQRTETNGIVTLFYTLLSLTRQQLLDHILLSAPGYFSAGTVTDPATVVDAFTFNFDTPLQALQELAALEGLELDVRRVGSTRWDVDLVTSIGGSTVEVVKFEDTFTDSDGTDLLVHTADTGEAWGGPSGAGFVDILNNEAENIWPGSGTVHHKLTTGPTLAIGDEAYGELRRPSGPGVNAGPSAYILLGSDNTGTGDWLEVRIDGNSDTDVDIDVRRVAAGVQQELNNVETAFALAADAAIRIGCIVLSMTQLQMWREPAGGGTRTLLGISTHTTLWLDNSHQLAGLIYTTASTARHRLDNLRIYTPPFTAAQIEFRHRKNLKAIRRDVDGALLANRIFPAGGGDKAVRLTIGEATFGVTALPSGTTVDLSGSPIFVDDHLIGAYLEEPDGTTRHLIDDTDFALQRVTLNTSHSLSVGERIKFRADAAGLQLPYVEDPVSQAVYGVVSDAIEEPDLPPVDNLIVNAAVSAFTAGVPDNWTAVGSPTLTQETSGALTLIGGASARVVALEGEGLVSDAVTIGPVDPRLFFSLFAFVQVASGSVEMFATHSVEGRFPEEGADEAAFTSELDRFIQLKIRGKEWPAGTVTISVIARGGAATFYLDAAQLTNTAAILPFFSTNAATELWRRGLAALTDRSNPRITYGINALDLTAAFPTAFPFDAVTKGGPVFVEDEELNLQVSTRIVSLRRDLLRAHVINVELSNSRRTLIDALTGRRRRNRQDESVRPSVARIGSFQFEHRDDGTLVLRVFAGGGTRSFRYIVDVATTATFAEVVDPAGDSVVSNVVDGSEVVVTAIRDGGSQTQLGKGQRAFVRIVAYPILSAAGVPGESATGVTGPPSYWNAEILSTTVVQSGDADGGNANVERSWTVDPNRASSVRVYRRLDAWPTKDGLQAGTLDKSYDRGTIDAKDSWRYNDSGWAVGDSVRDIAIAIDANGFDGERQEDAYTVVAGGPGSGTPRFLTTNRVEDDQGVSCASQRSLTLSWTTADVTDALHTVEIIRVVDGGPEILAGTVSDPVTTTSFQDNDAPMFAATVEPPDERLPREVDYILRVQLSASPFTILDTATEPETDHEAHWILCPTPE